MKTDHALGELFTLDPDLIKLLVDLPPDVHYTASSEVVKEVERRLDCCFVPNSPDYPVQVVEFQGYRDDGIYLRGLGGASLYGLRHTDRPVHIVYVFLNPTCDPETPPWHGIARSKEKGMEVIYLNEVVARLRRTNPENPAAALLNLLTDEHTDLSKDRVRADYQTIQNSDLSPSLREQYGKIFIYWLMQRLGQKTREEVNVMLDILTPFKETRFYKDFKEEVLKEAAWKFEEEKQRGMLQGQLELCQKLVDEGHIDQATYQKESASIEEELKTLNTKN